MVRKRVSRSASRPVVDLTFADLETPSASQSTGRKRKQRSSDAGSESQSKKEAKKEKRVDKFGRTVRVSSRPSIQVEQRIQRALPGSGHRLFLIQRGGVIYDEDNCPKEEFTVLGATGNVYTVDICKHPCCNCPDNQKGNLCKHILFVLLRVLKVPRNNQLVWQKAYLTDEVFQIFEFSGGLGGNVGGDVQAPQSVIHAFNAEQRGEQLGNDQQGNEEGRRKIEGDCPICFDELVEGAEELVWCRTCGNNVHKGCFVKWQQQKRMAATCVYCRAAWHEEVHNDNNPKNGGDDNPQNGGYVNLAQYSSEHRNADTSLEALYGDGAYWIYASQGTMGRSTAARIHRSTQHR